MAGNGNGRRSLILGACLLVTSLVWSSGRDAARAQADPHRPAGPVSFQTGAECMACHNGLVTPAGEDVSIGVSWRASMMAHSSRDPYWHGAVRREAIDHPEHAAAIEDECSICHMPMTTYPARAAGELGRVFTHLPAGHRGSDPLAADGVSCTVCHQITRERLGSPESFTGGYVLNVAEPGRPQPMFGPFDVDEGRTHVMRSATGLTPTESPHVRQSELCATCHTLFTQALDAQGRPVGRLPEQVPFLEWQHSAYRDERSCQDCHMPVVAEATAIASVVGEPREGLSRHTFLGGNVFMLRMLNRYRNDLGVTAPSHELEAAAAATARQLQLDTATVQIADAGRTGPNATFTVVVSNLTGHKLPTGYPSRRAWLHVTARDASGRVLFESGAVAPTGAIAGNDNDDDATRFEPHYEEIRRGGPGADLRVDHGGRARHTDHRAPARHAVRQGQQAAAARLREVHGASRRGRPRSRHRRRRLPRGRRPGPLRDRRGEGAGPGHNRGGDQVPDHLVPMGAQSRGVRRRRDASGSPRTTTRWRRDRRSPLGRTLATID